MREREEGETVVEEVDAGAMLATAIRFAVDESVAAKRQGYNREQAELAGRLRQLEIDVREQGKRADKAIATLAGRIDAIEAPAHETLKHVNDLMATIAAGRANLDKAIANLNDYVTGLLKQVNELGGRIHDVDGAGRRLADRIWAVEHLDRLPTTLAGRLRWLILGR